jgi:hypothetical protein
MGGRPLSTLVAVDGVAPAAPRRDEPFVTSLPVRLPDALLDAGAACPDPFASRFAPTLVEPVAGVDLPPENDRFALTSPFSWGIDSELARKPAAGPVAPDEERRVMTSLCA